MRSVTAADALESLRRGDVLREVSVVGPLSLRGLAVNETVASPLRIVDSHLESLDGEFLRFAGGLSLENTTLSTLSLMSAYFPGGLDLVGCVVSGPTDFQCGGHNVDGHEFRLERCTFRGFVNFFDCWFEGPVLVRECRFEEGANLLGNLGAPMQVQFDVAPVIDANAGALDRNDC